MFKFLKRKKPFVTTRRAEDLEVGDLFIYDYPVVVKAVAKTPKFVVVDIDPSNPDDQTESRTVSLYRELLITVGRY